MKTITVPLGPRSYDIIIGEKILDDAGSWLKRWGLRGSTIVISDSNVAPLYGETVVSSLEKNGFRASLFSIPAGEANKTLEQTRSIYSEMVRLGLERGSFVASLGGGVTGDIAGFAAATFLRGIAFVQIPTTLLAQIDASIGGKVGVNLPEGKNLVGAFHQPRGVLIDHSALNTLPKRELSAGFAEVIKHAIIRDPRYFDFLESNSARALALDPECIERIIARSCEIKAEVVAADEREKGLRMILNLGHTIGHALESVTGYARYLHGEAVAAGIAVAAAVAEQIGILHRATAERILNLLKSFHLPIHVEGARTQDIIAALAHDKKVQDGGARFVLPKDIGEVVVSSAISQEELRRALKAHGAA